MVSMEYFLLPCALVRVFQRNRTNRIQKGIYYEELAHVITEVEISQYLLCKQEAQESQ